MTLVAVASAPILVDESSLLRRYLAWTARASAPERAEAANALARAYLHSQLTPDARGEALIALTRALDDPEPQVRRALAEAFAAARNAPRHIVVALACDLSEAARPVLAQSPVLTDSDLVDAAAVGDVWAQIAIARRARVSCAVAAALAEVGERGAVLALLGNLAAEIDRTAMRRILDRFPDDADVRERLVERPGLSAALRAAAASAAAAEMTNLGTEAGMDPRRAERLAREGREQAFVAIAAGCPPEELPEFAAWLRETGRLTMSLMTRLLCCGVTAPIAQSLADITGMPATRVQGLMRDKKGQGFAALYARAGLPAPVLPAFRLLLAAAAEAPGPAPTVHYLPTMKALREIEALGAPALAPYTTMLWRLASEAARADAQEFEALALAPDEAQMELPTAAPVLSLQFETANENIAPVVSLGLRDTVAA